MCVCRSVRIYPGGKETHVQLALGLSCELSVSGTSRRERCVRDIRGSTGPRKLCRQKPRCRRVPVQLHGGVATRACHQNKWLHALSGAARALAPTHPLSPHAEKSARTVSVAGLTFEVKNFSEQEKGSLNFHLVSSKRSGPNPKADFLDKEQTSSHKGFHYIFAALFSY